MRRQHGARQLSCTTSANRANARRLTRTSRSAPRARRRSRRSSRRDCSLRPGRRPRRTWASPSSGLRPRPQSSGRPGLRPRQPAPRGLKPGAWFRQPMPAWAQAAAACLIFGAGLSLGVLRGTIAEHVFVGPACGDDATSRRQRDGHGDRSDGARAAAARRDGRAPRGAGERHRRRAAGGTTRRSWRRFAR